MTINSRDRADVEGAFSKYLQSLEAADVALASQVWLQSPEVLVVTPIGRFQGWDGVKEIWARTGRKRLFGAEDSGQQRQHCRGGRCRLARLRFRVRGEAGQWEGFAVKGLGEPRVSENRRRLANRPSPLFRPAATLSRPGVTTGSLSGAHGVRVLARESVIWTPAHVRVLSVNHRRSSSLQANWLIERDQILLGRIAEA